MAPAMKKVIKKKAVIKTKGAKKSSPAMKAAKKTAAKSVAMKAAKKPAPMKAVKKTAAMKVIKKAAAMKVIKKAAAMKVAAKSKPAARPKAATKPVARPKAAASSAPPASVPGRSLPRSAGSPIPAAGFPAGSTVLAPYDVDMNISDASKNMSKFYRMQVVKTPSGFVFVQNWGRIGTPGQVQSKGPFPDANSAIKLMESKFKQKSGKRWEDRDLAGTGTADSSARKGHGSYELTTRLVEAGARMATKPGQVAVSLMWDNMNPAKRNDLDLWITPPSGERIGFRHKRSACGGELDVDRTQSCARPVENIVWSGQAPRGLYKIQVHNFSLNHNQPMPFQVGLVLNGDKMQTFDRSMPGERNKWMTIKSFTV